MRGRAPAFKSSSDWKPTACPKTSQDAHSESASSAGEFDALATARRGAGEAKLSAQPLDGKSWARTAGCPAVDSPGRHPSAAQRVKLRWGLGAGRIAWRRCVPPSPSDHRPVAHLGLRRLSRSRGRADCTLTAGENLVLGSQALEEQGLPQGPEYFSTSARSSLPEAARRRAEAESDVDFAREAFPEARTSIDPSSSSTRTPRWTTPRTAPRSPAWRTTRRVLRLPPRGEGPEWDPLACPR